MFRQKQAVAFVAGTASRRTWSAAAVYFPICFLFHAVIAFMVGWCWPVVVAAAPAAPATPSTLAPVTLLTVDGPIGPASADYVVRGLSRAAENGSQLVVLKMDTPGGLDTSMRSIIKAILRSPVPVATYVAPSGARAASAGTYILYASHFAAMAPATNLGAATPVQMGGPGPGPAPQREKPVPGGKDKGTEAEKGGATGNAPGGAAGDSGKGDATDDATDDAMTSPMTRKQVNDAAAYIRGLAQMRGRNAEWAERAVREAVSLSAQEALKLNVIDAIATDVPALLVELDGKTFNAMGQDRQLQTIGAPVIDAEPDWRARFLATITNPSIALILMSIGIYGLVFEFMNPGVGVPGVIGGICLLLALYALQLLPVNYVGLGLIILGMVFMVAEAFLPSFGVLGLGGIAAFVTGAVILIDTDLPGFGIPLALIASIAIVSALLLAAMVGVALKTRRLAVTSGPDELIGSLAEVVEGTLEDTVEDATGAGWVHIRGETWKAVSRSPLHPTQKVRVVGRNGLVLQVVPAGNNEKGE